MSSSNAVFGGRRRVPPPVNEPIKSYAPGSPERASLKARLKTMAAETADMPMFIGGKEIRTGDTATSVMPHDHRHVLGSYHKATEQHIVDVVGNLDRYFEPGSLDVIFLNGVIGWGLDTPAETEIAFAACHRALRRNGHFMIGWNDLPEHRPFRLETIASLGKFEPLVFPPLETSEHLVANEWRHTFSFYRS